VSKKVPPVKQHLLAFPRRVSVDSFEKTVQLQGRAFSGLESDLLVKQQMTLLNFRCDPSEWNILSLPVVPSCRYDESRVGLLLVFTTDITQARFYMVEETASKG
jgi:hypothetical protein